MPKILRNKSNIDLDYPICRPSLDLDFTQEVLDERITFSRGTIGTRVNRNRLIETIPANQPRFDYDPVTGECKGILIEESRVNSWLNSGQSNVTAWNTGGVNLSFDNTVTAPDGTTNTIKCVETNTFTSGKNINQSISVTSGTSYTFSIFAKQPENSPLRYFSILFTPYTGAFTTQIVSFDPKNGTVLYNPIGNTTFVQKYPNGWWRFGVTATAISTTGATFDIRFTNSVGSGGGPYGNYTGDGSSFLYFYGPQVENGAFMTSFIPTTTAVTRSADLASMTGTNFSSWYNQSEGSIYCSANNNPGVTTATSRFFYAFERSDGTTVDFIRKWIWNGATGLLLNSVYTGGRIAAEFNTTLETLNKKTAISYKQNYFIRSYNGSTPTTDIVGNLPVGINQVRIGTNLSGTISRLTYYPRALKPNQLQLLTQ